VGSTVRPASFVGESEPQVCEVAQLATDSFDSALEGQPDELRTAAINSLREALAPLVKGDTVVLPGSIWIVTAEAG
jgi:hypothetical protein